MNIRTKTKSKKIATLYSFLVLLFLLFLGAILYTTLNDRDLPSLYTKKVSKATRGSIISADGYSVASTQKLYRATINTNYLDPLKKDLFVELFSIYSNIPAKDIYKKLADSKDGAVVLSYSIPQKEAQYLKQLSYELNRLKVFVEVKNKTTGKKIVQGLNIIENGDGRIYKYADLLTPLIGYTNRVNEDGYMHSMGVKGIEKRFESDLVAKQDELSQGLRDVNGYVLLNGDSFSRAKEDGLDIKLTIPVALQLKIEKILDEMKLYLGAEEIMVALMDVSSGNLLSLASSNRYVPDSIQKDDYQSLNIGAIEYGYEPGSVIKPLTFAILLDNGRVNPYDMINGYGGKYQLGKKVITDEHKFDRLSAEEVIIYSSNIGTAQLAQRLSGTELSNGFISFGLSKPSIPDLYLEQVGSIPHPKQLDNEIYKATCAYGYGMKVNLLQLVKAYSAFNNNGKTITPRVISSFIDSQKKEIAIAKEEQVQVISSTTAARVKDILIKTVNIGTGIKAKTDGLEIGGKTGTAHIVEAGQYVKKYNTSFLGFVNDKEHRYTMGVRVLKPSKSQFAAQTSVPVFKKIVDLMVEEGYLKPNIIEQPSVTNPTLNQDDGATNLYD